MADESLSRVTVYKLKLNAYADFSLSNYDEVASGKKSVGGEQFSYWLHFLKQNARPPKWFKVFEHLNLKLPNNRTPNTLIAGFVLVLKHKASFYAITGGIGHIHLNKAAEIEHRFGIDLAEKILSLPELNGLIQKDTSGVVNRLDRVFRGSYNPGGELDNLRRVLTHIRGRLGKKSKHYETIGRSIQAGNALTVNGAKSFDQLFQFVLSVDKLVRSKQKQLTIPQLAHIDKKYNAALLAALESALVEQLRRYKPDEEARLFLDNEEIGYLPDRIVEYDLRFARHKYPGIDSYEGVFEKVAELLQGIPASDRLAAYKKMNLRVTFDDDATEQRDLAFFVCGDVTHNNEVYFINNKFWYQADPDFLKKLDRELDNVACVTPDSLGLIEWDAKKFAGHGAENAYNTACTKKGGHILLDCRTVKIPDERGGVEFCDLLGDNSTHSTLIHVKHANGAALRALFAQVFVAAKLYSDSQEFRKNVHTSQMNGADGLKAADKKVLAALQKKYKREFQVVFAIFDDTESHKVAGTALTTSQVLQGTLTPFAKVDFFERVHSIRSMGYDVAVTRIKPYPN